MIEVSTAALAAHPFLRGMPGDHLETLAEAARDVSFPARHRLFEDGGSATRFWLIQSGRVSLDLHVPGEGPAVIETVGMGELLGWSWLFPPYKWAFGAIAVSPVEAFEFDAPMVRARCAADPALGYELNQRITRVLARRLQATRIRLITRSGHSAAVRLPGSFVSRNGSGISLGRPVAVTGATLAVKSIYELVGRIVDEIRPAHMLRSWGGPLTMGG